MAIEVTESNFDEKVIQSDVPVVVDLWAEWCGPCKLLTPIMEEMTTDYEGKALIAKVDVDSNPGIAAKFGVRNIPTVLFFKNGEVVDKQVGAVPKDKLTEKLDTLI
ncbi:thioredoxin [Salinivirga cyanobacteriivorans]|uniref:Thioredoxin n=1 Tax=Salinivirga cyanobacteriivorans TaxID=1307839 RepID=A0A0S2I1D1_9BACT|nr:thioredoxin [Salinivirga cyanobacteriivorans]ALO16109.1 Thioredoxin [Salinivirga cyanobacteriivorans]